jgi:hypothetical protein
MRTGQKTAIRKVKVLSPNVDIGKWREKMTQQWLIQA